MDRTTSDGNGLNTQCAMRVETATSTHVTYSVVGDTTATGGVARSTGVWCKVVTNSSYWGQAWNMMPGPVTAAIGKSDRIPTSDLPGLRLCAYGSADYNPNATRLTPLKSGCPIS